MGISKLTEEQIYEYDVNVKFYNNTRVVVDTEITPIYCTACSNQTGGMYHYDGSRYGQVGTVICDVCHAEILCTDDDNYRYQIHLSTKDYNRPLHTDQEPGNRYRKITLDFSALYLLSEAVFETLTQKGFDLSELGAYTQLSSINHLVREQYARPVPELNLYLDSKIRRVPPVVLEWYQILNELEIAEFTSLTT
ncbi:hypothetical protein [Paenibacillus sp. YPG26]|uniref:hypothetical protein n=1 Tax=Paenibacillus sp. YPG26 TaxID=2878915 RepID=UPI0020426BF3|nr:hypothetical protein [Paenibacillus sp. YPG26]USB33407.1 hypothetical protein LDO05_00745 [Paenibacillus sp. YPG26]